MRFTRRDAMIACASVALTCSVGVLAQADKSVLGPAVFDWNALPVTPNETGSVRAVVRQPTATLNELEMHITTLNPGVASHPPHKHPNEELVIIREGNVETLSGGVWKRAGPGSIIFNASNSLHALRNVGSTPAVYHVINWTSATTPKS
ncbi:cupin domain-containing protein [Sphingomonas crusticola]|uniref:cupin domain-containing protein n=1 Tax=Sphingomonas crusticola TaxID=1697973 RepID=UPI000E229FC6|nr:cupin domain-containing protein [Sphingomonas crusticola]